MWSFFDVPFPFVTGVARFADEHNPLVFSEEDIEDYIDTAMAWANEVHRREERAKHFFFVWNCLWKSGASIVHGHAQVTMTSDMHYAKIEHLRRATQIYQTAYGSNYFDDLYNIHDLLGLAIQMDSTRVLAYLTPVREKELLLISGDVDDDFKHFVYQVLYRFTELLSVRSFNLAICMPPIGPVEEDWRHFPVIAWLVDRGDLMNRTCDVNGMDLYASSVIASAPFVVADILQGSINLHK